MIATWACATKTLLHLVDDDGQTKLLPTLDVLPDWQRVSAAVAAGTLTIADFAPPVPVGPPAASSS